MTNTSIQLYKTVLYKLTKLLTDKTNLVTVDLHALWDAFCCRSYYIYPAYLGRTRNANVLSAALVTGGKGEWSLSSILGHNEPDAHIAKG